MQNETSWLIERRVAPPQWATEISPTGVGAFYSDIHRAYRFPTKQAAEDAMRRMSITPKERAEYFVSEHAWVGRQSSKPMPDVTQRDKHGKPAPDSIAFCGSQYIRADLAPDTARLAALEEALRGLVTAVTFADPPKLFNDVLCHEARVPVGFIQKATQALGNQP